MKELPLERILEALLFSTGIGMDIDELVGITGKDKKEVEKALRKLQLEYNNKQAEESALMIVNDGNTWRMIVRERYTPFTARIVSELEMAKPVLQTLAVIAWKSPVMQSEIVKIRGNSAYDHIKELEEKGFISREKKGHSYELKTTRKFTQYFEVVNEKELRNILSTAKPKRVLVEEKKQEEKEDILEEKKRISEEIVRAREEIKKDMEKDKELLERAEQVVEKTRRILEEVQLPIQKEEEKDQGVEGDIEESVEKEESPNPEKEE